MLEFDNHNRLCSVLPSYSYPEGAPDNSLEIPLRAEPVILRRYKLLSLSGLL
jgi:hypothetical protein